MGRRRPAHIMVHVIDPVNFPHLTWVIKRNFVAVHVGRRMYGPAPCGHHLPDVCFSSIKRAAFGRCGLIGVTIGLGCPKFDLIYRCPFAIDIGLEVPKYVPIRPIAVHNFAVYLHTYKRTDENKEN